MAVVELFSRGSVFLLAPQIRNYLCFCSFKLPKGCKTQKLALHYPGSLEACVLNWKLRSTFPSLLLNFLASVRHAVIQNVSDTVKIIVFCCMCIFFRWTKLACKMTKTQQYHRQTVGFWCNCVHLGFFYPEATGTWTVLFLTTWDLVTSPPSQ